MYKQLSQQKKTKKQPTYNLSQHFLTWSSTQFHKNLIDFIHSSPIQKIRSNIKLLSKLIYYYYDRCKSKNIAQTLLFFQEIRSLLKQKKQNSNIVDKIFYHLLDKKINLNVHTQEVNNKHSQLIQNLIGSNSSNVTMSFNFTFSELQKTHPEANDLILKIAKNQMFLSNRNCLSCLSYEQSKDTGHCFFQITSQNNPTFDIDFRKAVCASMNSGGGYIYLNKNQEYDGKGLTTFKYSQSQLIKILRCQRQWLKCASQNINNQFQNIKNQQITLQKIPIYTTPFIQQNNNIKYIIRVKVLPVYPRVCYVENQVKSNKVTKKFYIGRNNQVVEVEKQHIYKLILSSHQLKNSEKLNNNNNCIYCLPKLPRKTQKLLSQIKVMEQVEQQIPYFKYKNSTMLCISSSKYEEDMMKKVVEELKDKKIVFFMNKPFRKYVTTAIRVIYFVSHQCQFNQLNKLVRGVDEENKIRCIIVTKYLQVKMSSGKKQNLQKMQNIFNTNYGYIPPKQEKWENAISTGSPTHVIYVLKSKQQAIFSFIYLDNLSFKLQFVKEYFVKNVNKKQI